MPPEPRGLGRHRGCPACGVGAVNRWYDERIDAMICSVCGYVSHFHETRWDLPGPDADTMLADDFVTVEQGLKDLLDRLTQQNEEHHE